jgi:hypothetical protein
VLYDLKWLAPGQKFPPKSEVGRLKRYDDNEKLFAGDHMEVDKNIYSAAAARINRVVGNFEDVISFPVILNYQRLLSLKTSDLVCGEFPGITGKADTATKQIKEMREATSFDELMGASVIDISRFGETVWRIFKDEETGKGTFTAWTPKQWFPIVRDDGTYRIAQQVLAWRVNIGTDEKPVWRLKAQIHDKGKYLDKEFTMDDCGCTIKSELTSVEKITGLTGTAVINVRSIVTTGTVYGFDDYMSIDSLIAEILVRIAQISAVLDKHADPAMTGPASMLKMNAETGRYYLEVGNFFAVSEGEEQPKYLTWDGRLESSFKQLELLIDQLYILSEMGSALLGASDKNGQAISGTAMRFKMVNPLVKARRIANQMTTPVKRLIASISELGYDAKIEWNTISIVWKDGLVNDPRELAEQAKLVTGAKQVMPMLEAIQEYFEKTPEEAKRWYDAILKDQGEMAPDPEPGNGVDPRKKGSKDGMSDVDPGKKQEEDQQVVKL